MPRKRSSDSNATFLPDAGVLVVGAHIGSLVVPLSKKCREVVAFEANPSTYRLLAINLRLNDVTNCRAVNLAANDVKGTIEFLMSRANSGASKRVPLIKEAMYYYDNPETVSVEAVRLDDYLDQEGFGLVVMDIEGSEYFALQGMQRILQGSRALAVEFLPHHLKNVSRVSVQQFLSLVEPHSSTLNSRRRRSGSRGGTSERRSRRCTTPITVTKGSSSRGDCYRHRQLLDPGCWIAQSRSSSRSDTRSAAGSVNRIGCMPAAAAAATLAGRSSTKTVASARKPYVSSNERRCAGQAWPRRARRR